MRILHVLAERGFSGGENQLLATVRHLQAGGHEQHMVLDPRASFRGCAEQLEIPWTELRFRGNYDLIAARRLRRRIDEVRPDLVHLACSRSHKIGALATLFGRRNALPPRVVTRRMDYPIGNTPFRRWIYGRAVSAVVVISAGVRDAVLAVGVDPGRVHLIHEGVATRELASLRAPERRAAARARLGLDAATFFGVTNASLHRRKAHEVLLEALAGLDLPSGKRLVWLFGGDGPERAALQARAAELSSGIEVRIPGRIDYVQEALAAADAFCLPSRYEGLGVALLEAMASGVPCIASRVGGMREVLESGVSGLHVEPGDVAGLRAAVQSLVVDASLAARLGAAGSERARDLFDVTRMGEQTEALYRAVCAGSATPHAAR